MAKSLGNLQRVFGFRWENPIAPAVLTAALADDFE
jgi:hypothetical protein